MAIPFTKFTTRKWAVLTSKIDKLLIGIGIICPVFIYPVFIDTEQASPFIRT
jgi:hypothetical protein